jgi:cytochrome c biogenesis protein
LGVYVVHGSILIILIGAAIGSSTVAEKILHQPTFAYKGSIMLPEGQATNHVIAFKRGTHIDLGFHLHCDDFSIEYYANGMPKTYRSAVSILEQGKVVRKGASYQPYQQYRVVLQRQQDGLETKDIVTTAQEVNWPQGGVSYGIVNRESRGEVTGRLKIWFSDGKGDPSIFWVQTGQEALVKRSDTTYRLVIDQLYATGLQATKDPGVGLVYGGCVLMLAGLYVAFFLSHRRLFALIRPDGQGCRIFFAGDANKNRIGFEKKFSEFINKLEH